MFIAGVAQSFSLAYHDPVWSDDGTPEGAQTAIPVVTQADNNTPLLIMGLILLYLMAKD